MAILDWIVIAVSLLLLGLFLGLAIGYLWGRATGSTRGDLRIRSFAEQIDETAGGMLQHTQSAGDQLAQLVGLIKHTDAVGPLKSRPEAAYLAGIAQALFRLQEQLASLRESAHRVEQGGSNAVVGTCLPISVPAVHVAEMFSTDAAINAPVPSELAQDDIGSIELALDERRAETRQPYNAVQRFAPYRAGIVPTPEMFHEIRCCNISSGGLAFLTRLAPETSMIVVTTGEEPDWDFHTARVASVKEVESSSGTVYRVGCQFIGRLHLSLAAVLGWFGS